MNDALNNPVKRSYNKREVNTADMDIGQHADMDISGEINRGEGIALVDGDVQGRKEWLDALAFNEEPVTIVISDNSNTDLPETHVPIQVNGKGAEILYQGKWIPATWIEVGTPVTMKRKYVEVLLMSKPEMVSTQVTQDGAIERNKLRRKTLTRYPVSVLEDKNPNGIAWAATIMRNL